MPWWMQVLLLVAGILVFGALLLMPFNVFGLKSRLETIEARLDEIQGEIRSLALRLPEPGRFPAYQEEPLRTAPPMERPAERAVERPIERAPERPAAAMRPPIPPAAWTPDSAPRRPIGAGVLPPVRQEPNIGPRREPRFR
jgi:hypothetical protein